MSRLTLVFLTSSLMYLNLHAKLIVGSLEFNSISSAEIRSSFRMLTDTAKVVIPRRFQAGGELVEDLNDVLKPADPVEVWLGYNGELELEFKGYLDYYEPKANITLHFQDEMFKLKTTPIRKTYKQVKLADLLADIAPGYEIITQDIALGNIEVKDLSPVSVLKMLENKYSIFSYFKSWESEPVLYSGFAYDQVFNTHLIHLQRNVKNSKSLTYQVNDPKQFKVTAISNQPDGKKVKVTLPDDALGDAEIRTLNYGPMTSAELKAIAQGELKRFSFSGFRGDIKTFGQPVIHHGDQLDIEDAAYGRNSFNLVEETVTRFGHVFFERTNKLGPQV